VRFPAPTPPASTRFCGGDKKRLAAPQKTIYNRKAKDGTRWLATRFSHPLWRIFHFGEERRCVGPFMLGLVPANE
jgi:hypothetical protein